MHLLTMLFRFIWLTLFISTIAGYLDNTINWSVDDEIDRILDDNSGQFDHHEILFNSIYSMKLSDNVEYSIIVPSKYSIKEFDKYQFSPIRLWHFAFPPSCTIDDKTIDDWMNTLSAHLLIPCQSIKSIKITYASLNKIETFKPIDCTPITGLPTRNAGLEQRTFMQYAIVDDAMRQLKSDGRDQLLTIAIVIKYNSNVSSSINQSRSSFVDNRPFVRFSFITDVCQLKCNQNNLSSSIDLIRSPQCQSSGTVVV